MFLLLFLVVTPSSHLRHLSMKSILVDVSGIASSPCPELPYETPVDQIQLSGRFLVSFLVVAPSSHLRHLSIRSSFVDLSGLVSGRGSELPFARHVDQIRLRGYFLFRFWSRLRGPICDTCRGFELHSATHVDDINPRRCFWYRRQSLLRSPICDTCRSDPAQRTFLGLVSGRGSELPLVTPVDQI